MPKLISMKLLLKTLLWKHFPRYMADRNFMMIFGRKSIGKVLVTPMN